MPAVDCIIIDAMESAIRLDQLDSSDISDRLRSGRGRHQTRQEHPTLSYENPHPAAVLIPMFRRLDAWNLLFIRRTEHEGDHHSGQVAFPGGRWDPGDRDPTATALREAQEEIGLDREQVLLLGELRPMHTVSNFLVTPVVGEIPWPLSLRPDPVEVARVFSIPLAWLGDPANRRVLTWPSPDHPQARDVVFFDEFDQELLWGVSARITVDFLAALSVS
ncbi:MAG: CoA pyrophosphatase [Chromatiaceae bacterium]|nr:CoA pyrophosphatase [Chromatiaceae bacterium]